MREDAFVSKAPSRALPKTDWICAGFYETHNAPRLWMDRKGKCFFPHVVGHC